MRIIFMGTPDFAVPVLESLLNSKNDVVAVVTNLDRPSGRGNKISFSPVKECAVRNNIKVLQYQKIRLEGVEDLKQLNADIMITASFGQILSQEILDICRYGVINVHASLLPKYRGASPIQQSILEGDQTTGITIMQTDIGIDTGDILLQKTVEIRADETAGELFNELANCGSKLVLNVLDMIETGNLKPVKQNNELSTYTKMIKKSDGLIDFSETAEKIYNKIRAFNPFPTTFFNYEGESIKVHASEITALDAGNFGVGEIIDCDTKSGLIVACGKDAVRLRVLQRSGGTRMEDTELLKGFKIKKGAIIG